MLKIIPRDKVVYTFSPKHLPVEHADIGDILVFEAIDALGGQIKSETDTIEDIDWSRVDAITGPVYIKGAKKGDTLVIKIMDIEIEEKGFMVVVPKYGVLSHLNFRPKIKIIDIKGDFAYFDSLKIRIDPMIGTIGVAPEKGEIPTGSLGRHGGNMDTKEVTEGTILYLPVFTDGALLGVGDLHALQADGELSVSSIEISGKVTIKILDVIKGRSIPWPILNTGKNIEILACADTLDEAAREAAYTAIKGFMKRYGLSFEEAYMLGSLLVDLRINQVVDPKKGIRASIPLEYMSIDDLLE